MIHRPLKRTNVIRQKTVSVAARNSEMRNSVRVCVQCDLIIASSTAVRLLGCEHVMCKLCYFDNMARPDIETITCPRCSQTPDDPVTAINDTTNSQATTNNNQETLNNFNNDKVTWKWNRPQLSNSYSSSSSEDEVYTYAGIDELIRQNICHAGSPMGDKKKAVSTPISRFESREHMVRAKTENTITEFPLDTIVRRMSSSTPALSLDVNATSAMLDGNANVMGGSGVTRENSNVSADYSHYKPMVGTLPSQSSHTTSAPGQQQPAILCPQSHRRVLGALQDNKLTPEATSDKHESDNPPMHSQCSSAHDGCYLPVNTCRFHDNRPTKYFCFTCLATLCTICMVLDDHSRHDTVQLGQAEPRCRHELSDFEHQLTTEAVLMRTLREKLFRRQRREQASFESAVEEVNERTMELMKMLDKWQVNAAAALKTQHEVSVRPLKEAAGEVAGRSEVLDTLISCVRSCATSNNAASCLAEFGVTARGVLACRPTDPDISLCKLHTSPLQPAIFGTVEQVFDSADDQQYYANIDELQPDFKTVPFTD